MLSEEIPCYNELILIDGTYYVKIQDEEGDDVICSFENDGCVKVDFSKIDYAYLDTEKLSMLTAFILEIEDIYRT